jgi:hypothetical protein
MKDKYCVLYDIKNLMIHIVNLSEVYKSPIRSNDDFYLIEILDDAFGAVNFQEELKPEFMSASNFHKKGHLTSDARGKMRYVLLYDNEECCFKTYLNGFPELDNDKFSKIANFASEERCTIVGNILMDFADEKDISLQAAYMRFVEGDLWKEYKEQSIELTYQEMKKEAAVKPATGVVKIENPTMKFTISIDVVFENFIGSTLLGSKAKEMTDVIVYTERTGDAFEGYTVKGAYFYVPNELLKNAIFFITEDK